SLNPGFVVKPFRRYLNSDYKFPDRVRSLVSHYEFAVERFSSEQLEPIYFGAGLILAEFHGKSGVFYRVVLGTHRACHNEGEMLLKIETSKCDVVCFAIFTIGSSKNGKLQIELGTIQGQSKNTGHLEKFFSPSRYESDSLTAMGHGRIERASHGADGLFRC